MDIVHKRFIDWDQQTRRRLRHATLENGFMRMYMIAFPESPTIVAFGKHEIMGWAFILLHGHLGIPTISVFVNLRYRRHGLARVLITEALKDHEKISLAKWDKSSRSLFEQIRAEHQEHVITFHWLKAVRAYRKMVRDACSTKGCAVCELH